MKLLKIAPVLLLALVFVLSGCAANDPTTAGVSQEAAPFTADSTQENVPVVTPSTPTADEAVSEATYITASIAESAALSHAGVTAEAVLGLRSKLDKDEKIPEFDVDFCHNGTEYDYEINALTGEVIKFEKEKCDHAHNTSSEVFENTDYTEAVAVVLKHAGVTAEDILALHTDTDYDNGIKEYEIDFWYNGYEYEYDLNAETLEITHFEKEPEEKPIISTDTPPVKEESKAKITRDEAVAIVLKHAGVSKADAKRLEVELDKERGTYEYDIEFHSNGFEYNYEINAETGKIISYEKEIDD